MFEIGTVLYHTADYPTLPITRHVVDDKVKVVDADGKEQVLYHMSGYGVYFPEQEIVEGFSLEVKAEEEKGQDS